MTEPQKVIQIFGSSSFSCSCSCSYDSCLFFWLMIAIVPYLLYDCNCYDVVKVCYQIHVRDFRTFREPSFTMARLTFPWFLKFFKWWCSFHLCGISRLVNESISAFFNRLWICASIYSFEFLPSAASTLRWMFSHAQPLLQWYIRARARYNLGMLSGPPRSSSGKTKLPQTCICCLGVIILNTPCWKSITALHVLSFPLRWISFIHPSFSSLHMWTGDLTLLFPL